MHGLAAGMALRYNHCIKYHLPSNKPVQLMINRYSHFIEKIDVFQNFKTIE